MNEEAYVAYHGFIFLKGCSDTHKGGLQVQFLLEHEKDYAVFQSFNKRRKGKAGTGLYNGFTKPPDSEEWRGPVELKFLRWTVSSANGAVITFELEDRVVWQALRDKRAIDAGYEIDGLDRFEMMLVELDAESKPINVAQRAKLEKMALKRQWPKGGPQSKRAARLCREYEFQHWVKLQINWKKAGAPKNPEVTPDVAADWMREKCDLDTRAQLDHDPAALQRFNDRVMAPYLRSIT
jgi:hypothetical protein